jgi:hypothetical protein
MRSYDIFILMALARITITVPSELVDAADRRAAELDRSRSWVLVDALRTYLTASKPVVRETSAPYAVGLGPSRSRQLEADLSLTHEERVLLAQESAEVWRLGRRRPRQQVLCFDEIADFHAWERREAIAG